MTPLPNAASLRGVRIMFVLPSLGLAGAERQAFLLARYLRRTHHADVRLLSLSKTASMAEQCERAGLPFEFFQMTHGYRSRRGHLNDLLRFSWFIRRRRAQILMPYCMFQNILCALTWRIGGAHTCIWNQRDEGRSRLEPWIERVAVRQTPRFIANSEHGARFLATSLGVAAAQIEIVHNGFEPAAASEHPTDWRVKLGLTADAFVAGMVANLHGKKDHRTLITAWRQVVDCWTERGAPHLLLAGAYHDQTQPLRDQVAALHLEDHVHFLGEVTCVDDLLAALDLAVFSSFNEGVPNALLEAMGRGLAVVATDADGIREALGEQCGKLLAPPQNAPAMAERILEAVRQPDLRGRLGELGRVRVREKFGVARMGERMSQVMLSALNNR